MIKRVIHTQKSNLNLSSTMNHPSIIHKNGTFGTLWHFVRTTCTLVVAATPCDGERIDKFANVISEVTGPGQLASKLQENGGFQCRTT